MPIRIHETAVVFEPGHAPRTTTDRAEKLALAEHERLNPYLFDIQRAGSATVDRYTAYALRTADPELLFHAVTLLVAEWAEGDVVTMRPAKTLNG